MTYVGNLLSAKRNYPTLSKLFSFWKRKRIESREICPTVAILSFRCLCGSYDREIQTKCIIPLEFRRATFRRGGVINVTPSNWSLTLLSGGRNQRRLDAFLLTGTGKNECRHPVAVWLNFMRGRSGHQGRYSYPLRSHPHRPPPPGDGSWSGRLGSNGGGLADKNYPFKVEKRYKSVVKLAPRKRATYYHHPRLLICQTSYNNYNW